MLLREDILKPIPGDNPSGQSLRYAPIYDKIKEARREDDESQQGAWKIERKVADFNLLIKLAGDTIATESKDVQLAVWICEAALRKKYPRQSGEGPERNAIYALTGFIESLGLCKALVETFWDTLHPEMEDGDTEERAEVLGWLGAKPSMANKGLASWVKILPICRGEYTYFQYQDSRKVIYEDKAKTKEEKDGRAKALKEGKLAPEIFDKSFVETPKAFYLDLEKAIDATSAAVTALGKTCDEKFPTGAGPSLNVLKDGIAEFRVVVHSLLQEKRKTDPDPEEPKPPSPGPGEAAEEEETKRVAAVVGGGVPMFAPVGLESLERLQGAEPSDRREAIANVVAAAAMLRRQDPYSPAPYLMLRGLRFGELRASSDPWVLEAPPSDLRQMIKGLALAGRWAELLEQAENIMALPSSRAWLDLQRFVVEACDALGSDYRGIAIAIRSELRALLRDLPKLMDALLTDDTPAANIQTQQWLKELVAEPAGAAPQKEPPKIPVIEGGSSPGWQRKFIDAHALALEAMRAGKPQLAVTILKKEIDQQLSGRGRFQRKLQLAQICITAGKDSIAQPLLDDLAATIENHKLEEWEDREMVAGALTFLLQNSKKIQADAKAKQAIFERICRLDPVQALSV